MNVENIVVDIEINNSLAPDIEQSIVATIDNNINVIKDNTDDLDVTINRKEYVITGDEIYIPKRYEDAPTWLQNMIDQVVEYSIGAKVSDMNQVVYSLNQMIEAMEVSKNTYEMSVISSNDIDTRINTAITTLNSNMNDADATILSVANTKTTPEEAEAIMINAVRAELESTEAGTIGAAVATLSTAIANEEEARSTSVETLYSTMEGEFEATATAFNTINTYIGIDEAGASTGTGLSGYLEGTDGQIGSAGSKLINDVALKAGEVENKFAYNSTVTLNGVAHNSGFGLATSINSASIPEGDSQFWVSANEFKVVGANQTADAQGPFTVNTTTGDITFRGKVTFNSGQIGTIDEAIAQVVDESLDNKVGLATLEDIAVKLGYLSYEDLAFKASLGQTIIIGGYLRTGLIEASAITSDLIDAYAITGKYISGGTINGTEINGTEINGAVINGAVINGSVIKASYLDLDGAIQVLTNYHLCITQAKLNAVIAAGGTGGLYTNSTLMPDAIAISIPDPVTGIDVIDEYRIPSLSVLNWNGGSASTGSHEFFVSGTFSSSLNTSLYAYNVANAGVNTKAVKIRPIMSISAINMKTGVYGINELSAPSSIAHCIMYFGNIQLCKLRLWTHPQESHSPIRFTIDRYGQSSLDGINTQLDGVTFTVLGISFSVSSSLYDYPADPNGNPTGRDVETTITVTKAIGELGFDFLSGSIRFDVYAEKPTFSDCRASVSSTGISINNML